jgi:CO/xanthine dehydrogenase FAD-binding subunit
MITQYHRPHTLEEALELLSQPNAHPLGGGTVLTRQSGNSVSAVDLQLLGLDKIHKSGNNLEIGATVILQNLLESVHSSEFLKAAIELEAPLNVRNMMTVAGSLVTCDGRSPFSVAMLAMDATIIFAPGSNRITMGNYLPQRGWNAGVQPGLLITKINIPLNIALAFETVARTPVDKPIVCAALAQWPSERRRLVLGGWGPAPTLVMDGNGPGSLQEAARNAYSEAGDEWASAEYRSEIASVLAKRCMEKIA